MLRRFEKKYRLRSETFYAAYCNNPEPQDIDTEIEFCDWFDAYLAWQTRQADYRNEVQRIHGDSPTLQGLLRVARAEDVEIRKQFLVKLKAHMNRPVSEEERELWRKFDEDLERGGPSGETSSEREDWYHLSAAGLERAYGEDEPEYTADMVKEPNPDHEEDD